MSGVQLVGCGDPASREAMKRREAARALRTAAAAASSIMALELCLGYLAGSLALLSDGAHQMSDVALYGGLLWVVRLSEKEGDLATYSFGYHRAQVVGTLVALLLQYFATGLLVTTATARLLGGEPAEAAGQQAGLRGTVVLPVALLSLVTNALLLWAMPEHGHGHSHGGGGSSLGSGGSGKEATPASSPSKAASWAAAALSRLAGDSSAAGAARLHMVGDLAQGGACVLAGAILWVRPDFVWADSVSAFVYAFVVVLSSFSVLQSLLQVLMECAPPELPSDQIFEDLARVKGVIDVHCCHVWMLAPEKVSLSAHFHVEDGQHEEVLHAAQILLRHKYGLVHTTLQISDDEDLA